MSDPTTSNILLAVPTRGSDVGTWDTPVNGDFSAIDGYLGGVQTISLSNAPVTLTAPAGTVTAGGGPTQAQNGVLRFTGGLTADVQVTLPLPGYYIVENLTTGAFVVQLKAPGGGQIIAVDQGDCMHVYNNATDVRFINFGRVGHVEIWAGVAAMPRWVTSCTVAPYLLCDGSIYNFSTYPYLGARLGGSFGGNGITTFGVPDLRGRVPLPVDTTGSRITNGGCGISGASVGSAGGSQLMQQHLHNNTLSDPGHSHTLNNIPRAVSTTLSGQNNLIYVGSQNSGNFLGSTDSAGTGITLSNASFGSGASQNVQPSQVTGIAVVRAA